MYVIIDSNDNNRIVLGPMEWRPKYFSLVLSDEYDQEIAVSQGSANLVPYEIISGVVIRECDTSYPSIDPDIEDYSGPSWTVHANGSATAVWGKVDKPLHIIKDNYRARAAAERYNKETTSFLGCLASGLPLDPIQLGRVLFLGLSHNQQNSKETARRQHALEH